MEDLINNEEYSSLISSLFDESLLNTPILKEVTQTFYYIDTKSNFESNSTTGNLIGFTEYKSEIENNIKDGQGVIKVTIKEDANVFMSSKSELTEEEIEDFKKRGYDLVAITKGDQIEYIVLNDKVIEEKEYLTQEESSSNYSKMEAEYKEASDEIAASIIANLSGQTEEQKEAAKKAEAERKRQEAKQKAAQEEARKKREEYEKGKKDLEDRMRALNLLADDTVVADEEVEVAVESLSSADINPDPGFLSRSILKINDVSGLLQSLRANISGFSVDGSLGIKNTDFIEPSKEFVNKLISEDGAGNITGSVSGYAAKLKKFRDMLASMNPDWELYENINALSNLTEFGEAEGLTDVELANQATEYSDKIQKMIRLKNTQKEIAREEMWTRNGNGINKNKKMLLYDPETYKQYSEAYDFAKKAKDYYNDTAFNRVAYESIIEDKNLTEEEKAFYLKNEGNYEDLVTDYSNGKFKMLAYDHIVNEVPLTGEQQEFYDKWSNADVVQEYSVYKYCLIASDLSTDPSKVTKAQQDFYDGYTEEFNAYARELNVDLTTNYNNAIENGMKKANPYCTVPIEYRDNPYMHSSYYVCEVELTDAEKEEEIKRIRTERAKAAGVDESEITVSEEEIPKTKKVDVYNQYSLATDMERYIISVWAGNGAKENRDVADRIKEARKQRIDEIGDLKHYNYYRHGQGDASIIAYSKELGTNGTAEDYAQFITRYGNQLYTIEDNISYCLELASMDKNMHDLYMQDIKQMQECRLLWQEKYDLVSPEGTYATEIYNRERDAYKFDLVAQQCQYAGIMQIPEAERTDLQKDFIKVGYPQFVFSYQKFETERLYDLSKWQKANDENEWCKDIMQKYALSLVSGPKHNASKLDMTSAEYRVHTSIKGTTFEDQLYQNYVKSIKRSADYDSKIDKIVDASFNLTIYLHDFEEKAKLRINKIDYKIDDKYRVAVCYDADGNEINDVDYREIALYYVLNGKELPDRKYTYGYMGSMAINGTVINIPKSNKGIYIKVKKDDGTEELEDVYYQIEDKRTGLNCLDDTQLKSEILSYMDTKALETNNFEYFSSNMDYFAEFGKKIEGKKIANEWLEHDTNVFRVIGRGLGNGFNQFCHGFSCVFGDAAKGFTTPEDYALGFYTEGLVTQYGSTGELVKAASEIFTSIGNMGIPMVVGIAGQILNYFCPPLGVALSWASTALMGVSAGGNAYEQGLKQGMTDEQAIWYGIAIGASEALLEKAIGGISGLSTKWLGGNIASVLGIPNFLADILSEGIEESIQEMLDPVFKYAITGKWEGIDWQNVLKSGVYGMITAGIMNGGTSIVNGGLSLMLTGTTTGLNTILAHYQDGGLAGNVDVFKTQLQEMKALSKSDPGFTNTKAQITGNPAFEQNYREYSDSWDAYKDQLQERYDAIKDDKSMSKEAKEIAKKLESMNETGKLSSDQFIEQLLVESIMNNASATEMSKSDMSKLSKTEVAQIQKILSFNGDFTQLSNFVAHQMINNINANILSLAIGTQQQIIDAQQEMTEMIPDSNGDYATGTYINESGEIVRLSAITDTATLVNEVNNMLNNSNITAGEVIAALGGLSIDQINALIANSSNLAQTEIGKFVSQSMKIYTNGLEFASKKYKSFFENFRDHGFKHAMEVTLYALSKADGANLTSTQTAILAFAALAHDFGMRGGEVVFDAKTCKSMAKNCSPDVIEVFANQMFSGTELTEFLDGFSKIDQSNIADIQEYLEKNISGKAMNLDVLKDILTKTTGGVKLMSEFEFVSSFVRSQHPLNSALDIIENSDIIPTEIQEYLENLLDSHKDELSRSGIEVDSTEKLAANVLAILAMTHSKSTSGISMFNSVSQWQDCINKLEVAAKERGIDINKSALEAMINNETIFNELVNYATWIRDGDAMSIVVSADGTIQTVMQDGGVGHLDDSRARLTPDNMPNLLKVKVDGQEFGVNKDASGNYYYTDADGKIQIIKDKTQIYALGYDAACEFLTETVTYDDGRPSRTVDNSYSVGIHASELYVNHGSEYTYDSNGNPVKYEATATVRISDAMPTLTFHDIVERLGEVNTYTNIPDRSFVIQLPAGTDSVIARIYAEQLASWVDTARTLFKTQLRSMLDTGKISHDQYNSIYESQMKFYDSVCVVSYNESNAGSVVLSADIMNKINTAPDISAKIKILTDSVPASIKGSTILGVENAKLLFGESTINAMVEMDQLFRVQDKWGKFGVQNLSLESITKLAENPLFMSEVSDAIDALNVYKSKLSSIDQSTADFNKILEDNPDIKAKINDAIASTGTKDYTLTAKTTSIAEMEFLLNVLDKLSKDASLTDSQKQLVEDLYNSQEGIMRLRSIIENTYNTYSYDRYNILADIDTISNEIHNKLELFMQEYGNSDVVIPSVDEIKTLLKQPKGLKETLNIMSETYKQTIRKVFEAHQHMKFGDLVFDAGDQLGIKFNGRKAANDGSVAGFITGGDKFFGTLLQKVSESGLLISDDIVNFERALNETFANVRNIPSELSADQKTAIMNKLNIDEAKFYSLWSEYNGVVKTLKEKVATDLISADANYLYDCVVNIFKSTDGKLSFDYITGNEFNAWINQWQPGMLTKAGFPEMLTKFTEDLWQGNNYTINQSSGTYVTMSFLEFIQALQSQYNADLSTQNNTGNMSGTDNVSINENGALSSRFNSVTEQSINDMEYAINQMMTKYGYTRAQAIAQIAATINEQSYRYITSYGGARQVMKQYSFYELSETLNLLTSLDTVTSNDINTMEYAIDQLMQRLGYNRAQAIHQIEVLVQTGNFAYMTSYGGARSMLQQYSLAKIDSILSKVKMNDLSSKYAIQVKTSNNFDIYFENNQGAYYSTYGVDQGAIYDLCTFSDMYGRQYTYRQAKAIVNKAIERGDPIPRFTKTGNAEYFALKNKLISKYGLSQTEASVILSTVDDSGACSYAATCNEIFSTFSTNPQLFESIFGFPMYKNIDGKVVPNYNELLVDLYVNANMQENGGNFLIKNGDRYVLNKNALSNQVDPLGRTMLNSNNQIYLSSSLGKNISAINRYLSSKGLRYNSQVLFDRGQSINISTMNELINRVATGISNGNVYSLGIYTGLKEIHLLSTDPSSYGSASTFNWNEGGGHAVFVTGINEQGFIVSSWGEKYIIPFTDLLQDGAPWLLNESRITR